MSVYFFDSQNGSDSFSGLSPQEAFRTLERADALSLKPGDSILLKRGCTFEGTLSLNDSGAEYNSITVSYYGEALARPVIKAINKAEAALFITGEYVTVNGIELTNPSGHNGISVLSRLHGATRGIIICNCYIHDVWIEGTVFSKAQRSVGTGGWNMHEYGGISFETNSEAPTWFENIRIENNRIENVNRTGIWFAGRWFNRFKNSCPWCANKADGMDEPWYPSKNIYIGYNYVDHAHGDGIVGCGCENLLMEYNKVFYANCQSRADGCSVGLWSLCSDGVVVQYNEVAFTGKEFGGDGEAFDIDNCSRNTLIQYNYSHDNGGGFILICNITCNSKASHGNHIIRNNLSVNDGTERDAGIITFTGVTHEVSILNNTVYTSNKNRFRTFYVDDFANNGFPQEVLVANNLFYSEGTDNWSSFKGNGLFSFESNVFHNCGFLPEKDNIIDNNLYEVNPVLQGEWSVPASRLEVNGFIPCWNSPLLRLGRHFESCADKDYMGVSTEGHNYIGAFYYKDANIG